MINALTQSMVEMRRLMEMNARRDGDRFEILERHIRNERHRTPSPQGSNYNVQQNWQDQQIQRPYQQQAQQQYAIKNIRRKLDAMNMAAYSLEDGLRQAIRVGDLIYESLNSQQEL